MGTAAQFQRIGRPITAFIRTGLTAHRYHTYLVTIFLAKQRLRAQTTRRIWRHDPGFNQRVLTDVVVHLNFDLRQLLRGQGFGMAKIKPQPIFCIQRSALSHVISQSAAQCLMQQMRRRVIGPNSAAPMSIHLKRRSCCRRYCSFNHLGHVDNNLS